MTKYAVSITLVCSLLTLMMFLGGCNGVCPDQTKGAYNWHFFEMYKFENGPIVAKAKK